MVGVKGKLNPFRITKEQFITLLTSLDEKIDIVQYKLTLGRYSFDEYILKQIVQHLEDLRLPTAIKDVDLMIWGEPVINFHFTGDYANYSISNAKSIDEASIVEQIILNFFKKHSIPRVFTGGVYATIIFCLALLVGIVESLVSIPTLLGLQAKILVPYAGIHLFVGLLCFTLMAYIYWSHVTDLPPHYSFIHSVIYLDSIEKSNFLLGLISLIIIDLIVAVISQIFGNN